MEHGTASTARGVEICAAEAVERVDVEMVLEELVRVFREEGVAFVNQAIREFSKLGGLVVRDEQLGGGNAGEFVFQQAEIGKFGDGELAGGVVDAGAEMAGFGGLHQLQVFERQAAHGFAGGGVDGAGRCRLKGDVCLVHGAPRLLRCRTRHRRYTAPLRAVPA